MGEGLKRAFAAAKNDGEHRVIRGKAFLDAATIIDRLAEARTERRAHEALIEASEQLRNEAYRARHG